MAIKRYVCPPEVQSLLALVGQLTESDKTHSSLGNLCTSIFGPMQEGAEEKSLG